MIILNTFFLFITTYNKTLFLTLLQLIFLILSLFLSLLHTFLFNSSEYCDESMIPFNNYSINEENLLSQLNFVYFSRLFIFYIFFNRYHKFFFWTFGTNLDKFIWISFLKFDLLSPVFFS